MLTAADEFAMLTRCKIGSHKMLLSAEIDCADPKAVHNGGIPSGLCNLISTVCSSSCCPHTVLNGGRVGDGAAAAYYVLSYGAAYTNGGAASYCLVFSLL